MVSQIESTANGFSFWSHSHPFWPKTCQKVATRRVLMDRKSSRSQFVIWISNGYGWMVCCCRGPYFYYCSTPPSIKDDLEIGRERAKHSTTYLLPFHRIYANIPPKSSILELAAPICAFCMLPGFQLLIISPVMYNLKVEIYGQTTLFHLQQLHFDMFTKKVYL